MKSVRIVRLIDTGMEALGSITAGDTAIFLAKTLELPWKLNLPNQSCIPTGIYTCKWTRSNRLSDLTGHDVFTYEVLNVPGRTGIRIHSANYFYQLLGCIALGDAHKDINGDGQLDVIHSGNTVNQFNTLMNKESFILKITNG